MCDCIKNIEGEQQEKLAELLRKEKKLTLDRVRFADISFLFEEQKDGKARLVTKTHSTLELQVVERKRPIKQKVVHNFCPFCGVKY